MARDPDALKIGKWAATGDVEDPEDGGIDWSIGWDISHSQPGGSLPKREHLNELHREVTALGVEVNVHGAGLEWDSSISYEHPALVTGSDALLYVSVRDSTNVDPVTDSGESHWKPLHTSLPNASATVLEVWPESHWPGFALRQADVFLVLYGMVVYAIRFNNQLLHRQSTLGKRRLGENRGFRPSF